MPGPNEGISGSATSNVHAHMYSNEQGSSGRIDPNARPRFAREGLQFQEAPSMQRMLCNISGMLGRLTESAADVRSAALQSLLSEPVIGLTGLHTEIATMLQGGPIDNAKLMTLISRLDDLSQNCLLTDFTSVMNRQAASRNVFNNGLGIAGTPTRLDASAPPPHRGPIVQQPGAAHLHISTLPIETDQPIFENANEQMIKHLLDKYAAGIRVNYDGAMVQARKLFAGAGSGLSRACSDLHFGMSEDLQEKLSVFLRQEALSRGPSSARACGIKFRALARQELYNPGLIHELLAATKAQLKQQSDTSYVNLADLSSHLPESRRQLLHALLNAPEGFVGRTYNGTAVAPPVQISTQNIPQVAADATAAGNQDNIISQSLAQKRSSTTAGFDPNPSRHLYKETETPDSHFTEWGAQFSFDPYSSTTVQTGSATPQTDDTRPTSHDTLYLFDPNDSSFLDFLARSAENSDYVTQLLDNPTQSGSSEDNRRAMAYTRIAQDNYEGLTSTSRATFDGTSPHAEAAQLPHQTPEINPMLQANQAANQH